MKYFCNCDIIFETEACNFWGNMKVILGHLDWGLGIKDPHSDQADKRFLDLRIISMFLNRQVFC